MAEAVKLGSANSTWCGVTSTPTEVIGEKTSQQICFVQWSCGLVGAVGRCGPQWWAAFAGDAKAVETTQWFATENQTIARKVVSTCFSIDAAFTLPADLRRTVHAKATRIGIPDLRPDFPLTASVRPGAGLWA
ncbi:MAG: hypothetical protein ABGY75_18270 [Gemmataceae bacterium]